MKSIKQNAISGCCLSSMVLVLASGLLAVTRGSAVLVMEACVLEKEQQPKFVDNTDWRREFDLD